MARRIGDVDEFEFKDIGENRNQGVSPFALFFILFYFIFCFFVRMGNLQSVIQSLIFHLSPLLHAFCLSEASSGDLGFRVCIRERRFYKTMGGNK